MEILKYDWDLTDIYKSTEDALLAFEEIKNEYPKCVDFKGKLTTRDGLLNYFRFDEWLEKKLTKFLCYLMLRESLNGKDDFARKLMAEYDMFMHEISQKTAFIMPEISKNKNRDLNAYLKDKDFENYTSSIESIIRIKQHIVPEKTIKLLNKNQAFGSHSDIFDCFNDVDLKFEDVEINGKKEKLTHATYGKFIKDNDQNVRKLVYDSMHKTYAGFNFTLAKLYLAYVNETIFFNKLEKYNSTLEKSCKSSKTPTKVFHTLVETVRENVSLFYKFQEINKKFLGLKDYYYFDNYVTTGKISKKFTYEESALIVLDALKLMGKDYISVIKKALNEGWVDVYEKPAKTSGGFNLGVYGVHPYVLLNHTNDYSGLTTLAHELGHCMHSFYSDSTQSIYNSSTDIMVAEVASIVNEILLIKHLLNNSEDKNEKLFYLNNLLTGFYSTVYRQTMFSEFEYFVYSSIESNKPLIVEDLNNKYEELQKFYFGDKVKSTEYSKYEWSRIPHFYRPYYVYKYATGYISACTIANKILLGEDGFLEKYKEFLSLGNSVPPVELLKMVGVDLTKKQTMMGAFEFYNDLLNEYEELTKE